MKEYISKIDAVDAVERANGNMTWAERDDCKKRLEELPPADVVRVVRCRDCTFNATTNKCLNPDSFFLIPEDDDFCSYGERKERTG